MISAVFDCMVMLQAATNEQGPAFACLALVEANEVQLHVSPTILAEVQDVVSRPKIRARFPHLTQERADLFLGKLATLAVVLSSVPDGGVRVRDPDDLPYLDLAIATNAGYLVSRDKDLLDLMKDPAFTNRCPQLRIVDPVAFLNVARPPQQS
jgi:putative PIN family toxin of toxin-antitoxin system